MFLGDATKSRWLWADMTGLKRLVEMERAVKED